MAPIGNGPRRHPFQSGLAWDKKISKSSIVSWPLFINPPRHLNRQLRSLQDNNDIDKVILHFKQFSKVFTTRRQNIGYLSLKYSMQYSNC